MRVRDLKVSDGFYIHIVLIHLQLYFTFQSSFCSHFQFVSYVFPIKCYLIMHVEIIFNLFLLVIL